MDEIAARVGLDYTLQVLINGKRQPIGLYAGHYRDAWLPAVEEANKNLGTEIARDSDIVVANAGFLGLGSITEISTETWHQTINTNLSSIFYLFRLAIPEMLKRDNGNLIVNGSIAAFKSFPKHPAYCASKGALVPLIKQIALDYGPKIRANLICPGPIDTPLIWDSAKAFPNPEKAVEDAAKATLLGRLGKPEDVAKTALFLASEESSFITGSAITVDGGIMSR